MPETAAGGGSDADQLTFPEQGYVTLADVICVETVAVPCTDVFEVKRPAGQGVQVREKPKRQSAKKAAKKAAAGKA